MTVSDTSEELMTRQQVAYLFRDTSAAVAKWARRGLLPEGRNGAGRPRYRRADVEETASQRLPAAAAMSGRRVTGAWPPRTAAPEQPAGPGGPPGLAHR